MDLKNLFQQLAPLLNMFSNQNLIGYNNQQQQNQNVQAEQNISEQNVCLYPSDFSSQNTNQKNQFQSNQQQQTFQQQPQQLNQNQNQNQSQNISNLLPLLSLIMGGKNNALSQLLSKNTQQQSEGASGLQNIGQILQLLTNKEEKPTTQTIDSYKKIE